MPGRPLFVPVTAGVLTTTTTTITSTVGTPAASAGPVYLHIMVKHRRQNWLRPIPCKQMRFTALFSLHRSNGGLSGGMDWPKWLACQIQRPQFGAVWDGSAGASVCLRPTACNGSGLSSIELEPLVELLSVMLDASHSTGAASTVVRAVRLAPIGITSISLVVTMVPELRQPELLSLLTWLWSPDQWSYAPVRESPTRAPASLRLIYAVS